MSRVRVRLFGPHKTRNDLDRNMDTFLDNLRIKYVDHSFSVVNNLNSTKHIDEQLFVGSIAYFTKDSKDEEKKKD